MREGEGEREDGDPASKLHTEEGKPPKLIGKKEKEGRGREGKIRASI